jgi:hypothetical protein
MNYRVRIPETPVPGKPLGRHVNHDPRSLRFLVGQPARALASVRHERQVPVFDQGNLGSCTGNASVGALGTAPLFAALPATHPVLDESLAVKVYGEATALDDYPGTYPPDDTGSDGLSVAKALKARGLISGYLHATSLTAMQAALQDTPVIVGTNWLSGMDNPDSAGLVRATGQVRGGHEYEVIGMDLATQRFECVNSWGEGWGVQGHFFISFGDMTKLLAQNGDCTQLLPLTVTPPIPTPVDADVAAWWSASKAWAASRHVGSNATAARAAQTLAKAKGL